MSSFVRTLKTLCRTPLVRQPSGSPMTLELASFSTPNRPALPTRLSSQINRFPISSSARSFTTTPRVMASDKGKMELYSDESGSTGAGIDDISKTKAAFDTSKGPEEAAKGIEQEVSHDFG